MNVKDSVDWSEQEYQDVCNAHSYGKLDIYEKLLSMCGIPRLLGELQKRQMSYMLSQRQQLLSNLQGLPKKLNVEVHTHIQQACLCRCELLRIVMQARMHRSKCLLKDPD